MHSESKSDYQCIHNAMISNQNRGEQIQWWFLNLGSDSPEILLVRTKSVGTDFHVRTNGRFSNPEISTGNKCVRISESSLYNDVKRKLYPTVWGGILRDEIHCIHDFSLFCYFSTSWHITWYRYMIQSTMICFTYSWSKVQTSLPFLFLLR